MNAEKQISSTKFAVSIGGMLIAIGIAWGTVKSDVSGLRAEAEETKKAANEQMVKLWDSISRQRDQESAVAASVARIEGQLQGMNQKMDLLIKRP